MTCICQDWKENIGKVNAPLMLQAARSGFDPSIRYDGVRFRFCPWCSRGLREPQAFSCNHADEGIRVVGESRNPSPFWRQERLRDVNIKYKHACLVKAVVISILLTLAYRLNAESVERVDANGTGLPFGANMNLSGGLNRGKEVPLRIANGATLIAELQIPATSAQSLSDRKAVPVMAALREEVAHSSSPPFTSSQTLSGKEGDAKCTEPVVAVDQSTKKAACVFRSNGSISVQPADAAWPRSVKTSVESGFQEQEIFVPYDNSLFIRIDLPDYLGLEIILAWTNIERARHQIIP